MPDPSATDRFQDSPSAGGGYCQGVRRRAEVEYTEQTIVAVPALNDQDGFGSFHDLQGADAQGGTAVSKRNKASCDCELRIGIRIL